MHSKGSASSLAHTDRNVASTDQQEALTHTWQDSILQGLAGLWQAQQLCDCVVVTDDGACLPAHKVCLAAASGYFRARFVGAWIHSVDQVQHAAAVGGEGNPHGLPSVRVPDADMDDVKQVLMFMYRAQVQVDPDNLERLLRLASFLEIPQLLDACATYMRQVLSTSNAVPLLILASRYGCLAVRSELVSYICGKFSSLCVQLAAPSAPPPEPVPDPPFAPRHSFTLHFPAGMSPPVPGRPVSGSWSHHTEHGARGVSALERMSAGIRRVTGRDADVSGRPHVSATGWGAPAPTHHVNHGAGPGPSSGGSAGRVGDGGTRPGKGEGAGSVGGGVSAVGWGRGEERGNHGRWSMEGVDEETIGYEEGKGEGGESAGASSKGDSVSSPPLCALPKELLMEVLMSDELTVDCELDVLQVVVDWVAEDLDTRMCDLSELLGAVRLEQIPASLPLTLGTASPKHTTVVNACQELLTTHRGAGRLSPSPALGEPAGAGSSSTSIAITTPRGIGGGGGGGRNSLASPTSPSPAPLPMLQASLMTGESSDTRVGPQSLHATVPATPSTTATAPHQAHRRVMAAFGRPRRHQSTMLVAAGGHDASWRSLKVVEVMEPTSAEPSWRQGPSMMHSVSFAAGARLDGELHVVSGTPLWSCVSRLVDGCSHWVACPNLPSPRAHAGVVSSASALFVLGGRSQVQTTQQVLPCVEILSQGSWTSGPPMTTTRTALAAAALRGGVYAIGGQTGKAALKSVEHFDLGSETWTSLSANLLHERKYAAAAVLGGRIYLVGGLDEMRTRLSLVEAYDPREGRWQLMTPLTCARSSAGVAALQVGPHGRIYAVGGTAPGDHVYNSVEAFVPEMGRWIDMPPLGCGRSGLALCAL